VIHDLCDAIEGIGESLRDGLKRCLVLAPSATFAPFPARRRAVLSPTPLLAPVLTTTFFWMVTAIIPSFCEKPPISCAVFGLLRHLENDFQFDRMRSDIAPTG
jgi:hypothetical protein